MSDHLIRKVYIAFDEINGFRTKNGWTKSFAKARIFSHKTFLKQACGDPDDLTGTLRAVPIMMVVEESDYTALKLGGFLE